MKSYLTDLKIIIAFFIVAFLMLAFINMGIDPTAWPKGERVNAVIVVVFVSACCIIMRRIFQ